MTTLFEVRKRVLAMLLAVVMAMVLVSCAGSSDTSSSSSGENTPCSECEALCEDADNVVDCREKCLRDCTP
jgi:hypothetical protein